MQLDELIARGEHVVTVCNACRYCEQFCPVFPAIERRQVFGRADLFFFANLCHNCGECLYACQYAPPHEFGINVPKTLAEMRGRSYEHYCWPQWLGSAFRRHNLLTGLGLAAIAIGAMVAAARAMNADALSSSDASGDFYSVVPHSVMVTLFGGVGLFVVAAIGIAIARFWKETGVVSGFPGRRSYASEGGSRTASWVRAIRDALTLRHLHGGGVNCATSEDTRTPWRRWFHHCTFYGFMLCFASTSVAAFYHNVLGWRAPYGYSSVPVLLGTVGGLALLVGPAGLAVIRRRRDRSLRDPGQDGLDGSLLALLFLTSLTGLALLMFRHQQSMGALLVVHLGCVLALFLTLPYGKFVHGVYRLVALAKHHREGELD